MSIYEQYVNVSSSSVKGEGGSNPDRFTSEMRFSDFEIPPGYVNPRLAIRDLISTLEEYEPHRRSQLIAGAAMAFAIVHPHQLQQFLDALRDSPVSADTSDSLIETLHFLNSHDRQQR